MREPSGELDEIDALDIREQRRSQRRRIVVRLVLGLVVASAAVWAISSWTRTRMRLDGRESLSEGYRAYVAALRGPLPPSWSFERVVRAHAIDRELHRYRDPRIPGLSDACRAIDDAEYDARGDEPQAPCHDVDLSWERCWLAGLGVKRARAQAFAERLAACETTLREHLESEGRTFMGWGLGGEPLPPPLRPAVLPPLPPGLRRTQELVARPSAAGAVVVEVAYDRACDEQDGGVQCERHVVWRLGDEGFSEPQRIESTEPVDLWRGARVLTDGSVLIVGFVRGDEASEAQAILGRFSPGPSASTVPLPASLGPDAWRQHPSLETLADGKALVFAPAGRWIVHPDLQLEQASGPEPRSPHASAGPSHGDRATWSDEDVATVGEGMRLHLRQAAGLVLAERRAVGQDSTALANRRVLLEYDADCEAWADAEGRVVVLCRHDERYELLTSEDGGVTWVGRRGA